MKKSNNIQENPLDILETRTLNFLPYNYSSYFYDGTNSYVYLITKWIRENTRGRFSLSHGVKLVNNRITSGYFIGFENQKEYTLFLLSCPYIRK